MVRFNDKSAITTVASGDILPITDISDSADDKKLLLISYQNIRLITFLH